MKLILIINKTTMNIDELMIQLKWIKKQYWNINIYNKILEWLECVWVEIPQENNTPCITLKFYNIKRFDK